MVKYHYIIFLSLLGTYTFTYSFNSHIELNKPTAIIISSTSIVVPLLYAHVLLPCIKSLFKTHKITRMHRTIHELKTNLEKEIAYTENNQLSTQFLINQATRHKGNMTFPISQYKQLLEQAVQQCHELPINLLSEQEQEEINQFKKTLIILNQETNLLLQKQLYEEREQQKTLQQQEQLFNVELENRRAIQRSIETICQKANDCINSMQTAVAINRQQLQEYLHDLQKEQQTLSTLLYELQHHGYNPQIIVELQRRLDINKCELDNIMQHHTEIIKEETNKQVKEANKEATKQVEQKCNRLLALVEEIKKWVRPAAPPTPPPYNPESPDLYCQMQNAEHYAKQVNN